MTTLKASVLIATFLVACSCRSQFLSFNKSYGGTDDEFASDMVRGLDGGFLLVGGTQSYGPDPGIYHSNGYMLKTDENGDVEWSLVVGGTGDDILNSVVPTGDGDYMATGVVRSSNDADIIVLRVSSTGEIIWEKCFGTITESELGNRIIALDGGQFVVAGSRFVTGGGVDGNMLVLKINGDGSIVWTSEFGNSYENDPKDIAVMDDGGFLVTGVQFAFPHTKMVVVKLDGEGVFQWDHTYAVAGQQDTGGGAVTRAPDGTFMVLGGSVDLGSLLIKMDNTGSMLWSKVYPNGEHFGADKILLTADSGFLLTGTGYTAWPFAEIQHALLVDPLGTALMHRAYITMPGNMEGRAAVQNSDGSFTLAGRISDTDNGHGIDMDLIHCSAYSMGLGSICIGMDDTLPEAVTPSLTMTLTLSPTTPPTMAVNDLPWTAYHGGDEAVICSNVNIREERRGPPSLKLYPNPAGDHVMIDLHAFLNGASLEILNSTGQIVKRMSGFQVPILDVDVTDLTPGLYLCRVFSARGGHAQAAMEVR